MLHLVYKINLFSKPNCEACVFIQCFLHEFNQISNLLFVYHFDVLITTHIWMENKIGWISAKRVTLYHKVLLILDEANLMESFKAIAPLCGRKVSGS